MELNRQDRPKSTSSTSRRPAHQHQPKPSYKSCKSYSFRSRKRPSNQTGPPFEGVSAPPKKYKQDSSCKSSGAAATVNVSPIRCLIFGSPGSQAPSALAKAKLKQGVYRCLRGVSKDVNEIQKLLQDDPSKHISLVQQQDFFTSDNYLSTREEYINIIENQMKDIKIKDCETGFLIWYSGHGKESTGDWPMKKEKYLKFEDIYDLYKKCFKGRPLYIVTDCCYSGAWVLKCADLLDRDGIKCGESAGMNIKVFASCLHTENAIDKLYIEGKGVKLCTNEDMLSKGVYNKTICFAEHRELCDKDGDTQVTLGVDFTRYKHCIKIDGTCLHRRRWSWNKYVLKLIDEPTTEEYLH